MKRIKLSIEISILHRLWAILIVSYLLVSVMPTKVQGQNITSYTFAASSGTFTALSSPINPSGTGTVDDGYFNTIPIGFDFWYMGIRYTTVSASTNGWLTPGADITDPALTNNLNSGGAPRPVIAPLWDDLDIQAGNNVSYKITGSAPNRVFTIQYLNTKWPYNASGTSAISFQVKLYESTGKIEFVYRPGTGTLSNTSASIGITAAATGSGNFLSVNNLGTSVSSTTEATVTSKPASGKTYAFTPPTPTAPGSLTFSAIDATSMTLNWSDLSSNEKGFVIYRSTDGSNYYFESQTSAGVTSSIQSGLVESTTYFWKVYAVSEGSLSTALSGNQATPSSLVLTDWLYSKAITIDYRKVIAGSHTNFPVLISITDADLKTKAQTDADDILFMSSDGTTKLSHEIESYNSATGTLVAWVQIPSLSSAANTVIYMYYGNAAATSQQNVAGTWNTNFKGVYHLNGAFADATSNAYNGTNTGTTNVTGKISNGRGFVRADGSDYITINGFLGSPTSFTLSAWATLTTADPSGSEIISIGDNALLRYDESGANKTSGVAYNGSGVWTTTGSGINYAGTGWHYVVYTFDNVGHSQKVYVDGVQVATSSSTVAPVYTSGGTNTFIGKHGNGNANFDFDGTIDEARVANTSRSAGWVLTEYYNQNSPSTFYSVGSETNFGAKIFTGTGNFSSAARWSGGTLPIAGNNLIIDGICTVDNNAGTDNIAYGTLTIGTATSRTLNWAAGGTNRLNVSDVTAGAGASTLNMTNGGTLIIRGSWASTNLAFTPGAGTIEAQSTITLPVAYATYNKLSINGAGITVSLASATAVNGTLTLSNGILANGAWLTMATGSTISRSQGSLLSPPTFAGTINLVYTGSSPVTQGFEMPVSALVLNNLTTNTGGVTQIGGLGLTLNLLTDPFDNLTSWTGDIGASNNQFSSSASSNGGSQANECMYLYGSTASTSYTASIYRSVNTTGYTSVNISWKQFIDNWNATSQPYTIKVQCASSSSGPWTDIYSLSPSGTANIGPEVISYTNWTTNVGGTFYLRYYITGYTYGLDYWYFDDLVIEAPLAEVASTVTVNGTLGLSSGTYAIGANTLALNGAISGSSAIVGSPVSNLNVGGSGSNLAIPAITNGLNNFSINRSTGVTLNGNATVNGILNLQSNNASATQGALHLGTNTLTMGASATTTGAGDVTGIVKRTSFIANIAYTFGNQFTTITFGATGTFPLQIQAKINIGTAPSWKVNAIKRSYDFIQTGGIDCIAGIAAHYLDTELNGNGENELMHWTNGTPGPPLGLLEWGRSGFNSTDNWVSISNISIGSFPTSFGMLQNTLAVSAVAAYTWNGSVSTVWGTSGNWTPSGTPSSISTVIIPDASTTSNDPNLPTSAEIKSMYIEAGGILNSVAAAQLTIDGSGGAWINQGGTFNPGTSNVTFTHAEATMSGTTNYYNVSIAPAAALIPEPGTIMRIAGSLTNNGILRAAYQPNTIEFNGSGQAVINPNGATPGYYNLILSGSGTKTMPGTALSVLGDFIMSGSASVIAANAASIGGNVTMGAGTSLNMGSYSHSIAGNVTNNGGTLISSTSSVTLNGSGQQTLTSSGGIAINNLIITNTSGSVILGASTNCSIGGNLTINAGAFFDLAANSLTAITGSVSNSGTVITQNTSSTPVPAGKTWGGSFMVAGTGAQTMVGGTYNNLSMIGSGGATASANLNVNGILNLASVNPSSIKGILDMGSYTLLMGPTSTTIGPGDVIGIVRRTSIVPDVTYTYGNQYTSIKFDDFGTLPSELSLKISIGTAPSWKPGAIKRVMELIQTGAAGTHALMYAHYLDSELNGNDETGLVDWIRIIPTSTTFEYGRSSNNTYENWVSISNANIGIFNQVFGVIQITLDKSEATALTWNGSTSTSWVTVTNWTPNAAPSTHTALTIPDAATTTFDPEIPIIASCGTMKLESGAILNTASNAELTINDGDGAWVNQGGTFNPGNSTIKFSNSGATMAGSTDFYNLTTEAGAVVTLGNNAYVGITGTFTNIGTMKVVGNGATTLEYKGGNQTVVVPNRSTNTYSNLILSGSGTKTMPVTALSIAGNFSMSGTATATAGADMTFAGDFTIGNGTAFSTGNLYHTVAGNFTNNGAFNASTGNTVRMNGASAQALGGTATTTFDNLIIDNINGVTLSGIVNVNNELTLASGNLTTGAATLGINGTISKTAGSLDVSSTTSLSFGGTSAIILVNDLFTTPPSIDNLTINRAGGVRLANQNMTVNGLLDLSSGVFNIASTELTITGISPTRTSGSIDAGNAGSYLTFANTTAITLPAGIFNTGINHLHIEGAGGVTASSDFTINGILGLTSSNPSATKGSLDMWDGSAMKTLTMGANASTIGIGDVTGIVKRTAFSAGVAYTFGNQFATVSISDGGTLPTQIQAKISIGASPSWKTTAINRIYEYIQTGGSNCFATITSHYLDTELNGNDENRLVIWGFGNPWLIPGLNEFGRSNFSTTDNWVAMANVNIGYLPTNFGEFENTLANSELESYTWNGSQSTSWIDLDNWTPVGSPSSVSAVIIPDATTTLNSPTLPATTEIKTLSIQTGAVLNSASNTELTINGDNGAWSDGGTFNCSTGKVIFTNASATISGTTNFYNVTIDSGAALYVTTGNTMRIAGSMTNTGPWYAVTGDPTTVEYNGGNQSIVVPNPTINSYSNLILSGTGTKTFPTGELAIFGYLDVSGTASAILPDALTVNGSLSIGIGSDLSASPSATLTVSGALINSAGPAGFVLHSDAAGTASLIHYTDNVPATVERYISGAAEAWHFLSSPIAAQGISGTWLPSGTYGNGTGYDLYLWNEPTNCWIYKLNTTSAVNWNTVHPGSNFTPGRGYLYSVQATNPTKAFVGNLNNGSLSMPLTASSTDPILQGFNLVGNPYPSSMDWQAASGWSRTDLVNSGGGYDMWIWNQAANNYGVFNSATGIGTNSITRYIAPMQGFFVKASVAGSLGVNNSVRVHDGAGWFKNTDSNPARINLVVQSESDKSFDEALVLFGFSANDPGAVKLFSHVKTAPSLYLSSGNEKYSVQYLTDTVDNPTVPVMFKPGKDGNYTLHCNFDNNNFNIVTLEDRQMHYSQDIKSVKTYNFLAAKTDDANRFVLHFGTENNSSGNELPARIYSDGNQLIIDLKLVRKETMVMIYDVLGRKMLQRELQGETQHELSLNATRQILVVFLKNANGSFSRKLVWAGN